MFCVLIAGVLAYLLGSIPFGLLLAKGMGYGDVRQQGSGNIGATNVVRVAGKLIGISVFLFDFFKAVFAIVLSRYWCGGDSVTLFIGLCAVVGHVFPVWLNFKGGKGVATAFGVLFTCSYIIAIISAVLWAVTFFVTRYVSLASVAALLSACLMGMYYAPNIQDAALLLAIIMLVVYRHKDNMIRLYNGQENKFSKK